MTWHIDSCSCVGGNFSAWSILGWSFGFRVGYFEVVSKVGEAVRGFMASCGSKSANFLEVMFLQCRAAVLRPEWSLGIFGKTSVVAVSLCGFNTARFPGNDFEHLFSGVIGRSFERAFEVPGESCIVHGVSSCDSGPSSILMVRCLSVTSEVSGQGFNEVPNLAVMASPNGGNNGFECPSFLGVLNAGFCPEVNKFLESVPSI